MSLRDQILASKDSPKMQSVFVPEWGNAEIFVKSLTAGEMASWESWEFCRATSSTKINLSAKRQQNVSYDLETRMQNAKVSLLLFTLCDSQGNRIFSDNDIKPLSEKNAAVISRLYDIARRMNGIDAENIEAIAGE